MVRVRLLPVELARDTTARLWGFLSKAERARVRGLHRPDDRRQFTVAHGALRLLAARLLNAAPHELVWTTGRHGKPQLAPPWARLHTSLSHSRGLVAIAAGLDRPVGVDLECPAPGLDPVALATRFFPPDEAVYIASGTDARAQADRFAHLWARKEAAVKAAGGRIWSQLSVPVRDRDIVECTDPPGPRRLADLIAPDGCRAAVALTGAEPFEVEAATWSAHDVAQWLDVE